MISPAPLRVTPNTIRNSRDTRWRNSSYAPKVTKSGAKFASRVELATEV
jgi:hypothetical protein